MSASRADRQAHFLFPVDGQDDYPPGKGQIYFQKETLILTLTLTLTLTRMA